MFNNKIFQFYKSIYFGHVLLTCTFIICICFIMWLKKDTELDEYREFMIAYDDFFFRGAQNEAKIFRIKKLEEIANDKIHNMWLPLVDVEEDSPFKIELYLGILAGDPKNEFTYAQIAALIYTVFPGESNKQIRKGFFREIKKIENVNFLFLKKYNLLNK